MSDRPHVRFDPAQCFGYPMVKGASVEAVAGMVWAGEPVDVVAEDYDIDRADVLVACWYMGLHGSKKWRKRWRDWVLTAHERMWWASTCDYTSIPDPPDRDELRRGAS